MSALHKFVFFLAGVILLSGCKPPVEPTVGGKPVLKLLETERAKAGLRLVKSDWRRDRLESDNVRWGYSSKVGPAAAKLAQFDASKLLWEEDYYYSGRTHPSADGESTSSEQLTINYDYVTGKYAVRIITDNAALEAKITDDVEKGTTQAEAFAVADTILSVWGLTRS
jgi:hypothetical protein